MDEITNESQMLQINKFIWASVGADLSRPPPIYRPSVDF